MGEVRIKAMSEHHRKQLVSLLREKGIIQSEQVAQAFLAVPREAFLDAFYEQKGFRWMKRTPDLFSENGWLNAIYADEPLVTLLDEQNWPISSSSMPTVMAMMLEALEVHPGMRVLEIGTGTGYNAALLAHLVGSAELVTTIDIEARLVHNAQAALHRSSGPVTVCTGDGRLGVPERSPYQRILATASSPGIPTAWYEQLAPNGRLVMDLQGSLRKSSFLVLEKTTHGHVSGRFDRRPLYFMPLRPGNSPAMSPTARLLREPVTDEVSLPDDEQTAIKLSGQDFLWFLQWRAPGMTLSKAIVTQGKRAGQNFVTVIDREQTTMLQLYQHDGFWSGQQRGGDGLWQTIEHAYREWEELGRPTLDAYYVEWDQTQEAFSLMLEGPEQRVVFRL